MHRFEDKVRGSRFPLFPLIGALALALLGAFINRWFDIKVAFGISLLPGTWLGVLAAMVAPWPLGALGPLISMLPTMILWSHPWALAGVLGEGLILAYLAERRHQDRIVLAEIWYWPLVGTPLALLQYMVFLRMDLRGAFAATSKQGINSIFNAVVAVIIFYFAKMWLKPFRLVKDRPRAKEYVVLLLNLCILFPTLFGLFYYARTDQRQSLHSLVVKTETILAVLDSELELEYTDQAKIDFLHRLLESTEQDFLFLESDGTGWRVVGAPDMALPWFMGDTALELYGEGDVRIVGRADVVNPMKLWLGAVSRAYYDLSNGHRIVVSQPIKETVLGSHNALTQAFLFLFIWIALAGTLVFWMAMLLTKPLEQLRSTAERLQKGDDSAQWPLSSILEIQELRESLVAMTGAIEQRNVELSEAKDTADRMMKRSERYLSFVAHELKAPLSALRSAIDVDSGLDPVAAQPVRDELFKESITGLLELIDHTLDQAAGSSDAVVLRSEAFNPSLEVGRFIEPFAIQSRRKGLAFQLSLSPELDRTVWGDSLRFRQLITNLVSNAIKYTESGSIKISLGGKTIGGHLKLTGEICDTGQGIEAERLDRIWIPFAGTGGAVSAGKKDGAVRDGLSSHGLGLSIVRAIVEAMGGTISVSSVVGQGSVFTFSIQLSSAEVGVAGSFETALEAVISKKKGNMVEIENARDRRIDVRNLRVLIADDEMISRLSLVHLMKSWGARVVDDVGDGEAALVKHQQEPYDLVVLDENMPGMNGRELMAAIRELDGRRDGPGAFIVYSTAEREVRGEGADLILPKPIAVEVLRRRVAGEEASR